MPLPTLTMVDTEKHGLPGAAAMLTESARMTVNPAALRVAQGGAEHVPIVRCSNLARALSELAQVVWLPWPQIKMRRVSRSNPRSRARLHRPRQ